MKKKDKKKNKKVDNSNEIVEIKEEPVKQQKVIEEKPEEPDILSCHIPSFLQTDVCG